MDVRIVACFVIILTLRILCKVKIKKHFIVSVQNYSQFEYSVLSLFGLSVGSRTIFMRLIFEAILSLVPIKQSPQDGWKAVFC